jgi:hypothetical protein
MTKLFVVSPLGVELVSNSTGNEIFALLAQELDVPVESLRVFRFTKRIRSEEPTNLGKYVGVSVKGKIQASFQI